MKKLCIGNWKMNCSRETILNFDASRAEGYNNTEIGIALPYVYLDAGKERFGRCVSLCAQDCSQFSKGAHTGDVSAGMLKESGVKYVILGHSERRHILKEPEAVLQSKLECCLEAGLDVLFCVGETLEQRESGKTTDVVAGQLETLCRVQGLERINIAYEPVWAIGSGRHAEVKEVEAVVDCIKGVLADFRFSSRVLYGGSVSSANCTDLAEIRDLDGFLVGNASLTAELFEIANSLEN